MLAAVTNFRKYSLYCIIVYVTILKNNIFITKSNVVMHFISLYRTDSGEYITFNYHASKGAFDFIFAVTDKNNTNYCLTSDDSHKLIYTNFQKVNS